MKKETIMTRQRLEHMIRLGAKKLQDPYYQGSAAEIAFYLLLSIVPTLILLSQVLGLFSVSLDSIREWLNPDLIHVEGADMILSMLDYSPSGVNSVFLALTAVWAASRAQFTMLRITNYTLSDGHSTGMGYVRDRIRSLKTVVITVFTIGFSLVILVYGELLLKVLFGIVIGSEMAEKTWMLIRWPIAAGLYFLMISYNYYVLPTHRVPYRAVVPGSIFSSIGLMVVTGVYSIYTSVSSSYDILYGSFSNFVALMFWFYLLSWVLFLGVILNKVWWETRSDVSRDRD
ncbi:MAG: YihY/virulence factor BrkB family protein [Firmicutes bacterium]|nr:YihY/virulence factor BrkB family protein [Bacillota bacterium]MDD7601358.1 YihY/virulence factor BrkB family protein [Bacillota bacterium]MDY5856321.1 YihY/virulence factor BrkB family protein [Anaerovoracaceae bacterium]